MMSHVRSRSRTPLLCNSWIDEENDAQAAVHPLAGWRSFVKRAEDIILGTLLLLCALPAMAVIAILVKLDTPGPVLFRQPRYGINNTIFVLLKFRTMHEHLSDVGANIQTSRKDKRVTRVGRLLRSTSLDELPQLFNVLAGSMSIVGPRPHALNTKVHGIPVEDVVPSYHARHRVKPGITGLAQVNGARGELDSIEKVSRRVKYDLDYNDSWSLWLDIRIVCNTVRTVLFDSNAY
jgi:polysaccharide biosynthesis protein PslA